MLNLANVPMLQEGDVTLYGTVDFFTANKTCLACKGCQYQQD